MNLTRELLAGLGAAACLGLVAVPCSAEYLASPAGHQSPPEAEPPAAPAKPPGDLEKHRVRLINALRPELRRKLAPVALDVMRRVDQKVMPGTGALSPLEHSRLALADANYLDTSNLGDGDIEALVFIVLMEAKISAQKDLKSIMAQVKALNAAKRCVRKQAERAKALRCIKAVKPTADMPLTELDTVRNATKDKLDSLSEMGEMESLRLQRAMERLSKIMSTLSNIMKKIADTNSAIVSNMK